MASKLALHGGTPTRTAPWPTWPVWGEAEEEVLLRVLRSGRWGCLGGSEVNNFGEAFAAACDAGFGVPVSCGTVALQLALLAAGIQAGDEVILPPYTFVATASAIIACNAVPVFADIDPQTYCLDSACAEVAITQKTRAIIAVHLGGQMADMDALRAICQRHNLVLIEDASHAHGSRDLQGRAAGSLGDLACFSFQASKNLNAGEGGIVLTNNERLATKVWAQANCGRLPDSWDSAPILGGNHRMTEWQGAILNAQRTRWPDQLARRDANGKYLTGLLESIPGVCALRDTGRNAYHLFCFRYDDTAWGIPREGFLAALRAEGIPAAPGYAAPLYDWPVFTQKAFGPMAASAAGYADAETHRKRCPVNEQVAHRSGGWLQQSVLLSERADMEQIADAIKKLWAHREALK
jgi:dTDP-4-amino-4,6-dideoxygalactose transaminase